MSSLDFRGLARTLVPRPGLASIYLALLTLAWYWMFLTLAPRTASGDVPNEALLLAGANDRRLVLAGEVWRLLASIFLHADTAHLLANLFGLFLFASLAEACFGWAKTLPMYLLAGIVSSISSISVFDTPSVGASGAVFGLMGAVAAFAIAYLRHVVRPSARYFSLPLVLLAFFALTFDASGDSIDPAAHLSGLSAGVVMGLFPWPRTAWVSRAFLAPIAVAASITAFVLSARSLHLDMPLPPLTRIELPGVELPWPRTWATLDPCSAKVCVRDSYGAVLLAGPAGDLLPGRTYDPLLTVKSGLTQPLKTTDVETVRFEVLLTRDHALVLIAPTWLLSKYEPLVEAILSGARFEHSQGP